MSQGCPQYYLLIVSGRNIIDLVTTIYVNDSCYRLLHPAAFYLCFPASQGLKRLGFENMTLCFSIFKTFGCIPTTIINLRENAIKGRRKITLSPSFGIVCGQFAPQHGLLGLTSSFIDSIAKGDDRVYLPGRRNGTHGPWSSLYSTARLIIHLPLSKLAYHHLPTPQHWA